MLNIVLILQGEIISWSLMGGEGLNKLQQCMEDYFSVTDYENLQGDHCRGTYFDTTLRVKQCNSPADTKNKKKKKSKSR